MNEVIIDNDSSLYKAIRDNFDHYVKKISCLNHKIKNIKGNIINLKNDKSMKLGNLLTDPIIDKICAYINNIVKIYG